MGPTLEALQSLQQVESKLAALRAKIGGKQRAVRAGEKKLKTCRRELAEKRTSMEQHQRSIAHLELDIKTHDAEVSKFRDALNRSKTNKEYSAILVQINTQKANNSKLEDRVLAMMSELEILKQEQGTLLSQCDREQEGLAHAVKAAETFGQDATEELKSLEQDREAAAAGVPPEALKVFERSAERHDSEALAMVVQLHPKRQEYVCDGCNMGVTLEHFISLQSRDDLQICNNCGRILILDSA